MMYMYVCAIKKIHEPIFSTKHISRTSDETCKKYSLSELVIVIKIYILNV